MKFLFVGINAKYIHSNPGLYSMRAYAGREYEKHIEIVEYTINHHFDDILKNIYLKKPDVLGFSCYIWNIRLVLDLVMELSKIMPEVPIWLGGPEVSFDAKKVLLENPGVYGIMVGEGEETFKEVISTYVKHEKDTEKTSLEEDFLQIKGLVFPSQETGEREITNLSKIPFLYHNMEPFENRIIYYETSRGCPYSCSYCLSSIEKKLRLRDLDIVKKELDFFLKEKLPQVKFVDRTFNCNHTHAKEIWKYLLEHDNGITNFHFELAGDILDEEEIEILNSMRPGLVQLEIGVQSTNLETLKEIDRVTNLTKLRENVEKITRVGNIHVHLDLIAGLPYEDYESFQKSFEDVYAMKPNQLQLGFLKVLKGSKMHRKAKEYGICYGEHPPYEVLYTKWLPFSDIIKLKAVEEMVELYYNSNQYTHTLLLLENVFSNPFQLFYELSLFYKEEGFDLASSSRSYRYQILLKFATKKDPVNEPIYKELLTFDLYLRENMKSRPDFSYDLEPYKKVAREFYEKEENREKYLKEYEQYDTKQLRRMTHFEPFYYNVYEALKVKELSIEQKEDKPSYILFDYQKRSPLTNEAKIYVIKETTEKL